MNLYNEEFIQWLGYEKKNILGCPENGQQWRGTKTGMGTYRSTKEIPELIVISKILDALQSRKFAEWFNEGGNFEKWQSKDDGATSDLEILKELVHIFKI
jgi:hypothetical protein